MKKAEKLLWRGSAEFIDVFAQGLDSARLPNLSKQQVKVEKKLFNIGNAMREATGAQRKEHKILVRRDKVDVVR